MKELPSEHVTTGCCLPCTQKRDWIGGWRLEKHKFSYNNRSESTVGLVLHTRIRATVKKVGSVFLILLKMLFEKLLHIFKSKDKTSKVAYPIRWHFSLAESSSNKASLVASPNFLNHCCKTWFNAIQCDIIQFDIESYDTTPHNSILCSVMTLTHLMLPYRMT